MAVSPENVITDKSDIDTVEHDVDDMLNDPKWVRQNVIMDGPGQMCFRIELKDVTLFSHETAEIYKKYINAGWGHVEVSSDANAVQVCLWNYRPGTGSDQLVKSGTVNWNATSTSESVQQEAWHKLRIPKQDHGVM